MKTGRSRFAKFLSGALLMLGIVSLGVMLAGKYQINQSEANIGMHSISDAGRNAGSLEFQRKQDRREDSATARTDYPIYKLSEKLRRLARDLESRSLFMESPLGFKNEDQWAAMDDCRGIIEELTTYEVIALIEYYRESRSRNMPINGNELVGPILFEHWGRIDGGSATAWIDTHIEDAIGRSEDPIDLTDPFAMDPSISDVLRVFSGWASVDATSALSTWEEMHANLSRKGSVVVNLVDLGDRVRSAISDASKDKPK